ncbi:MAG: MFS transporter [Anaerolineales bacterium]|nr:MAG: MFS transporter [Anaerolineales bacterium]
MHQRGIWVGWISLAAAFAMAQFHRLTLASMGDTVMADLGIGAATFGLIATMYFYAYALLMVPGGALADLYGPRQIASLGCAVAAAGAILFGMAHSPWWAMVGRLLVGGGVAVTFPCILRFQHTQFPPRLFGTLTGALVGSTTASSLLAYVPLALLVQSVGWRSSHYLMAGLTLGVGCLVWFTVRETPIAIGDTSAPGHTQGRWRALRSGMAQVLGNRHSWPPFLIQAGNYGSILSFVGAWAVPYLMRVHSMDLVTASAYAQIPLIGMSVGGPAIGWVSDRLELRRGPTLTLSLILVACWLWLVIATPPRAALLPLLLILGFTGGVIVTTVSANSEANPPGLAGISAGVVATGGILGAAVIQPTMSWLLDSAGLTPLGFRIGFTSGLAGAIIAAVASYFLLETYGRNAFAPSGVLHSADALDPS